MIFLAKNGLSLLWCVCVYKCVLVCFELYLVVCSRVCGLWCVFELHLVVLCLFFGALVVFHSRVTLSRSLHCGGWEW